METVTSDGAQLEMFQRDHTDAMDPTEFLGWMQNFAGAVSMTEALQISALILCCDVIAQDIAKATLQFRQRLENGTSKIISPLAPKPHEMAEFLALEPNRRMTWRSFVEMLVYWSCLTDNAYAGIIRAADGTVLQLIPFQSIRVMPMVSGSEIFYNVTAGTMQEQALLGTAFRTFAERDMIHIRTRNLDGMCGKGILDLGRKTIEIMNNLSEFRNNLFGDEGQIKGVFIRKNTSPLPDPNFARFRQQLRIMMNRFAKNAEPVILEGEFDFKEVASSPKDMELSQEWDAQILEICRMFRMPPHKIFALNSIKYDNQESMEKDYVGSTLEPRAQSFEEQFGKVLLSRPDRIHYFFHFDRAAMTLRDTKLETDRTIRAVERSVITIDEARADFGRNPLPHGAGNVRLVPTNMALVDENNQVIVAGASNAKPDQSAADVVTEPDENEAAQKIAGLRVIK